MGSSDLQGSLSTTGAPKGPHLKWQTQNVFFQKWKLKLPLSFTFAYMKGCWDDWLRLYVYLKKNLNFEKYCGTTFLYKKCMWKIKMYFLNWEVILIVYWKVLQLCWVSFFPSLFFLFSHANKTKKNIQPCKPYLRQVWECIISQNPVGFMAYLAWTLFFRR